MSHPLALVRAEIKAWERDFASRHGRDPALQDIRDRPPIADKYKLYKKLSKAAANPSTPPRSRPRLPVPKSRPAETIPLPGFNPFSPVKRSAHDHIVRTPVSRPSQASPHPNPFTSPCTRTPTSSPSPPPSALPPHPNATASSSRGHPAPATAVSRARKRLRGDRVSPSPNKPKRQRVLPQVLQPPILEQDSNSEHELDQELPQCDFTSSIVADSPVKPPAGGKSFKLLFDDALPVLSVADKLVSSSLTQLRAPLGTGQRTSAVPSLSTLLNLQHDLKPESVPSGSEHPVNCTQGKIFTKIFPTKVHMPTPLHNPTFKTVASEVSQLRTSIKRAQDDGDPVLQHTVLDIPVLSPYSLVPPSPPAQDSISRDAGKGKAKTAANRKRPRVEDKESDEGVDSPDDITLKIATIGLDRRKHSSRHADVLVWDPLLHFRTRNHDSAAGEQIDANHHASGTFTVDLPDRFHRVLAISPSRCQDPTEDRVVRGLLYGDRVGHYDPSRGGDIWDAGEVDEGAQGDVETEEDWEGEPVPWEVGEL